MPSTSSWKTCKTAANCGTTANNTLYLRSNAFSNRDTATLQARTAGQDQANKNTPEAPNNADNKNSNAIGRITASGKIDNRGNISSGGNIDLNTRDYQNSGTVAISQITLRDGKFDNRGGTSHFENADIRASNLDNRSGTLNFERANPSSSGSAG